jgi:hypothetical protein
VLGSGIAQTLVVLHLDAEKAAPSRRPAVRDEHIKRGSVSREALITAPGRVLESNVGDALDAPGRETAQDARREIEVARELAEQVEAEGLAR